jgi:hypothetical protein
MKKNCILLLFALLITIFCNAQTTQLRSNIKITAISSSTQIKKMIKTTCTQTVQPGFEIKDEYTFKNGVHSFTATAITPSTAVSYTIAKEKTISVNMPLAGKANIIKDEKDPTILRINFWLNHENKIPANTPFRYETRDIDCAGNAVTTLHPTRTLLIDTTCYLVPVQIGSSNTEKWFTHAETIITVLNNLGNPINYLVDKYDRDGDYRLELKNREFVSYKTSSIELGPLVVPFKLRANIKRDTVRVGQQIESNVNLGLFLAYSYGQYRLRREGDEYKDISGWKINAGGFVDFGTITLTNSSTSTAEVPLEEKQTAPIFLVSSGLGITVSKWDINAGLFLGWDFGIGDYAQRWNYNQKTWVGMGFGYNLSNFWKKK